MLPELPQDLSSLNDEDLAALAEQFRAFFAENRENATTPEAVADLRQAADAVQAIDAEQTARAEAARQLADEIAELERRITPAASGDDSDNDADSDSGSGDSASGGDNADAGDREPEPVAASGQAVNTTDLAAAVAAGVRVAFEQHAAAGQQANGQPSLEAMARFRPAAQAARPRLATPRATVVASADIPGFATGAPIASTDDLVRAFAARMQGLGRARSGADSEFVPVASIVASVESDRHVADGGLIDMPRVQQILAEQRGATDALTAASILCAPTQPYYEQVVLAVADRPIRNALVGFNATRGGIRWMPSPVLGDVASGVTTIAADPGTTSKPCVQVACPTPQEAQVTAIPACIKFDNFNARAWPEQIAALLRLLAAQQAKVAETYLLDGIAAASTAITAARGFGAGRQILANLATAVAAFRSNQRMDIDTPLRVMYPNWVPYLMRADLIRSWHDEPDLLGVTQDEIDSWFAALNVNVTYYMDTKTGGGQVFSAISAGTLPTFPSNVFWYLFSEGTFVHVDGGTLDFGLVRDSTLNAANQYQMMSESFENVARVGPQSLEVRSTVCADGTYAPAGSALSCPV